MPGHRGRPGRGRHRPAPTRGQPSGHRRRCSASPLHLVDVAPASEVLGLEPRPVPARRSADRVGPRVRTDARRAHGRCRTGGLVADPEDAVALFESGSSVSLEPCHHHGAVGPMAGVVTPSMWMWVLEDRVTASGPTAPSTRVSGKVLRYGAYGPEVLTRLRWMGDVLGPVLQAATRSSSRSVRSTCRHPDPDAADGRRGPQPQPRRHADVAARPRAGHGRERVRRARKDVAETFASSAATTTSS